MIVYMEYIQVTVFLGDNCSGYVDEMWFEGNKVEEIHSYKSVN